MFDSKTVHADCFPLTSPQREIWLDQMLHHGEPLYNIGGYMRIHDHIDARRFQQAVNCLAKKHDVLRTMLVKGQGEDGFPLQCYAKEWEIVVALHDFSTGKNPHETALEWMRQRFSEPFDLFREPLFRYALIKVSQDCFYWAGVYHHLTADGWTIALLARSLADIYTALEEGETPGADAPCYSDFITDDHAYLESPACEKHRQYWLQKFDTRLDPLFTARYHSPAIRQVAPSRCSAITLPREWYNRLIAFAKDNGVTTFHVILSALYVYFARTVQREELVIGLPVLNRSNAAFKATAGLFVGVTPARFSFGVNLSCSELLQAISRELKQNYRYQRFPVGSLNREAGWGDAIQSQLFDVGVSYERHDYECAFGQAKGEAIPLVNAYQPNPLMLYVREFHDDEAVQMDFVYHQAYFTAEEIEAIQRRFVGILDFMQQQPAAPVNVIPVLTNHEALQLREWNRTREDYPKDLSWLDLFARQCNQTPEHDAVVLKNERLTYRQLNERANRLARYLTDCHGVVPDTLVGLCMERSLDTIVGIIGILKAGGAYVPLDPSNSDRRLHRTLSDANIAVLLTQQHLADRLSESHAGLVCLDSEWETIARFPAHETRSKVKPANLAYAIHTSGSTGQPKGVAVTHANLLHSTLARISYYAEPVTHFLLLSSFAFDSSVAGIFWTLCQGGTLQLPQEGEHNDPAALVRVIERHAVSHLLCIPSFHALLLDEATRGQLRSLSTVIVAGESCPVKLVEQHAAALTDTALFNEYGPTEATVWSNVYRCDGRHCDVVPIGKPIVNIQAYILDAHLNPMPPGTTGELYLAGDGLARGYLNGSDLTAEKFIANPFSDTPGARMYRTGDLARHLSDGNIECLGRIDHQVKIRGFRIELGEIENTLAAIDGIRDAVVLAREDHPGDKQLVAYVVLHDVYQERHSNDTLRSLAANHVAQSLKHVLKRKLPEYMVPAHIVMLDSLPLNVSGKVDRKALPAPYMTRQHETYVAPRTFTEEKLAAIWMAVLRRDQIGIHDHFFELGGHSLLAMQVASNIHNAFKVELPLRALFEAPTLREMALRIEQADHGDGTSGPALSPVERGVALPLSFAQQRLWFLDQLESGNAFYNMSGGVRLTGVLNTVALEAALNDIVARHEVLRTAFDPVDGKATQRIADTVRVPFATVDLTSLPAAERDSQARTLAEAEAAQAFDLRAAPLLRARLLRLDRGEHWLLLSMHHIAADGWSMAILMRELSALYRAHASGKSVVLPTLPVQYADFAVWQRNWLQGAEWERQLGYWRKQLVDAPVLLELPTDRTRPAVQSHRGAHLDFTLSSELTGRIQACSRQVNVTLFMTLLSAFGVLLSRYCGQRDICIGTPIANRRRPELEHLIGCFVNTLVMRLRLDGNPAFADVLRQVRETALAAYAHQDVPFEQLVEVLQPQRVMSHAPLFQVMFALQNNMTAVTELDGVDVQTIDVALPIAKFDLTLDMQERNGQLHGRFEYNTDLFDAATIERMAGHFRILLEAAAGQPDMAIAQLPMLTNAEQRFFLEELNRSEHDFPLQSTYAALFAEQVARGPERIAAVCAEQRLTYRELDARSARIAQALIAHGAQPDTLVAVIGERSLCYLTMMLAVFKAGAAYVPLDVAHPAQRLREIVTCGAIPLVLASESSLPLLDQVLAGVEPHPLVLTAERVWMEGDAPILPLVGSPDDLAYVIFTSGSTGKPKGAMVEQKGMLNNLFGKVPALGLGMDDRVAQTASPAFDISVWQFLAAPLLGGTVHIMPDAVAHEPRRLLAALAAQQVTVLQVVPSTMRLLVAETAEPAPLALRWVLSIGEALPPGLAQAWFARFPGIPLINIYGPAECADNVAFYALHSHEQVQAFDGLASVPIGRPTANMQLFILDEHRQLAPQGVPGEICIAGVGVGRGYLNDPETTGRAFVDHPFHPGQRFYRTGDVGRYRADGNIDYLGRRDHQIKIRGQRIELGEIETQLQRLSGVRDAAAIVRKDERGDVQVVAFWAASPDHGTSTEALRGELGAILPPAMIPSHFILLDRLPLNLNGKVDRQALTTITGVEEERSEIEAPQSVTEKRLATIWSALLGDKQIGRDSNFFHLGGHSLLATQAMSKIRMAFEIPLETLPLRAIFEAPTVRELAARIDHAVVAGSECESPLLPAMRGSDLPLSFAQQRLWFLDQLEPGSALYNMPKAIRMRGVLNSAALEAGLNHIVMRHEALRTAFELVDGDAVQKIDAVARVPFSIVDLSAFDAESGQIEAKRLAGQEALRPFDLHATPLLRATLLHLAAEEHWLLLTLHHIAADGWSIDIVMSELSALYRAHASGKPVVLPALPVQYADFAIWQRRWLQGSQWERQLGYWRDQLAAAPALLDLPTDRPRPVRQSYCGAHVDFALSTELTCQLNALGLDANATLFMILIGVFGVLLSRTSGQNDICIGTPIANRQRAELDGLIGFFVNTLVMRLKLDGNPAFADFLRQVRETALAAYAHQDVPFEKLVEILQPERDLSHAPLFQAMFVLQNNTMTIPILDGLELQPLDINVALAKFDLTLCMEERDDILRGRFEYNTDLFDAVTIERMAGHFQILLEAVVARPATPVGLLPLLTARESELQNAWNRTQSMLSDATVIHALFERQAAGTPDEIAVVFEDTALSYGELNQRANRLGHYLRSLGVGPDTLVGLCVERSLDMIVGVFGVLKAGAAYLPLDPALPEERLCFLIQDAKPRLTLTQSHLLERLPAIGIDTFCMDRDAEILSAWPHDNPPQQLLPEHLAYVIYTSGSTGRPKGTLIHHRALVNLVLSQADAFGLQPARRMLQWASFNFDASVSEIFTALSAGVRLYLASRDAVLPGNNLWETLRRYRIEVVTLTPSALAVLPHDPLPDLKTLVVAGEQCDHALIAPWLKTHTVINAYGPTEATVCATMYRCSSDGRRHPPIGRPIANTQTYVLDAYLNRVPIGVAGELYIAGEGLARGYLNRPDLTAERFIQNPFIDQPGARMYKTGDAARYLPDGQLEYLGRLDNQVKSRGYRIEPGEIEFALDQLPIVREAAVLAQHVASGDSRLVAYVAPHAHPLDLDALRVGLRRSLPEYMMPAHFVVLDTLPINTSGKIDRTALNALAWNGGTKRQEAPRTPTEQRLAALWAALLAREAVGRDENFFHIGGHSLLAVQLCAKVKEVFGIALPISQIFMSPSVAEFAVAIDGAQAQAKLVVTMQRGTPGTPVFLMHPAGGTVFAYHKLARALGKAGPVHAIQSPEIAGLDSAPYDFDMLCRHYVAEIVALYPVGPLRLAGWSMGGSLALRMAAMLEQGMRVVEWVALFDALPLNDREPLHFADFLEWALFSVQPDALGSRDSLATAHARLRVLMQEHGVQRIAVLLDDDPLWLSAQGIDVAYQDFLREQYRIQQCHVELMRAFQPVAINAPLHVVWAEKSVPDDEPPVNWLAFSRSAARSTQCVLQGTHDNLILIEENVQAIAARLTASLPAETAPDSRSR